jgi:hypothetical protein
MKKVSLLLVCSLLVLSAGTAWAIPPFNDAFKKAYVKDGTPLAEKVAEVKCNVCHMGKEKKDKNEYGKAVGKFLKKADFTGDAKKYENVKDDDAQKALADGLKSAEAEKGAGGKTFGELIKAGELPSK